MSRVAGTRGHAQRARLRAELEPAHNAPSGLAKRLLDQWGFGLIAATEVQRLALLAVQDHCEGDVTTNPALSKSPPMLVELARMGSWGRHPNHVHSQLTRWASGNFHTPAPLEFACTMRNLKRTRFGPSSTMEVQHAIYEPSVWFNKLYYDHPMRFARCPGGLLVASARYRQQKGSVGSGRCMWGAFATVLAHACSHRGTWGRSPCGAYEFRQRQFCRPSGSDHGHQRQQVHDHWKLEILLQRCDEAAALGSGGLVIDVSAIRAFSSSRSGWAGMGRGQRRFPEEGPPHSRGAACSCLGYKRRHGRGRQQSSS